MEMTLRSAIIISAVIHVCLFAPFYNQNLIKMEMEKKRTVVVDYVVLKEIAEAIKANKEVVLKTPETPRIDIQKEITPKQEEAKAEKSKGDAAAKAAAREAEKKDAALKSNKDYISYYQIIREKIRARLKNNYRYYSNEGDVYLSFAINPNGSLSSYSIDRSRSTTNEVLLHITAESLKAVSPFPVIPKTLSSSKMSFSIMISFKR